MLRKFETFLAHLPSLRHGGWAEHDALNGLMQAGAGVLGGAVALAIVLSAAHEPLPQPGSEGKVTVASIIPFLSASGLSESASFHRLLPQTSIAASRVVQFRRQSAPRSAATAASQQAPVEPLLKYDFHAPRKNWQLLPEAARHALDLALDGCSKVDMVLHSAAVGGVTAVALRRHLSEVREGAAGSCDVLVTATKVEILCDSLEDGALDVVLVGDFRRQPPTEHQFKALDEVSDYLRLKIGALQVLKHVDDAPPAAGKSCLGPLFPIRQVAAAIAQDGKVAK